MRALWITNNATDTIDIIASDLTMTTIPVNRGNSKNPARPTGIVFNPFDGLYIPNTNIRETDALVATQSGTVNFVSVGPSDAAIVVPKIDNSKTNKSYTGLAINSNNLYLTNFGKNGKGSVDAYTTIFDVQCPPFPFCDPHLPENYSPFNIYIRGDIIYVLYALNDLDNPGNPKIGDGNGMINLFDLQGCFLNRVINPGGILNVPSAIIDAGFLDFGLSVFVPNSVLVNNFGDGLSYLIGPCGQLSNALADCNGVTLISPGAREFTPSFSFMPPTDVFNELALFYASNQPDPSTGLPFIGQLIEC